MVLDHRGDEIELNDGVRDATGSSSLTKVDSELEIWMHSSCECRRVGWVVWHFACLGWHLEREEGLIWSLKNIYQQVGQHDCELKQGSRLVCIR